MAKMKTFAVEVEITLTRTIYVDARRPNGALERLSTRDGWRVANMYNDDPVLDGLYRLDTDKNMTVTKIREV